MVLSWCKLNCGFGPWILNHYKLKQLGTIIIDTLCQREIIYSCSIKIHASGLDKLLKSIFCLLLVVEAFSLQNVVEMLEEVVAERSGEYGEMRQNFVAQFVQLLKCWLCNVQSSIVMQKNWALSVEQCLLQVLQFLMQLTDLLSILFRWNGFSGIQNAVVDETGSRPPFFGASLALGSAWKLLSPTS